MFTALYLLRLPIPKRGSSNLYHSGIATLTIGSCLRGIFDIYGTTSDFIFLYWLVGGGMILSAVLIYGYEFKSQLK